MEDVFLQLVRLGISSTTDTILPEQIDWNTIEALAKNQGLFAVVFDGVEELPQSLHPPLITWLRWIGVVQLAEARYIQQCSEACKMAHFFHQNSIRTYVLKGNVVSECYPVPKHRVSSDFDCFLLNENQNDNENDSWEKGNCLIEDAGCEVEKVFYKNSTFHFPGLTVENHRFLTPFRGNKTLQRLEQYLQSELRSHKPILSDFFHQTSLLRPPVMVSALFLIEHAYSHFLHEGLAWRHVLDWVMFSHKHEEDIDWGALNAQIDKFGFRKFYDAFTRLGKYLFGEIQDTCFTFQEKKMLEDIWAPLDVHETVRGFKGKLALAGNTWRARWKYRYFTEITWFTALWIQVKGFLFEKTPKLY